MSNFNQTSQPTATLECSQCLCNEETRNILDHLSWALDEVRDRLEEVNPRACDDNIFMAHIAKQKLELANHLLTLLIIKANGSGA